MSDVTRRDFLKSSAALTAVSAAGLANRAQAYAQAPAPEGTLEAGVAVRDITPPSGVEMWGYSNRQGPSTGTLDPLFAKTVVLRGNGKTFALTVCDLGRMPVPESMARIRARAAEAGVDDTVVMATHTHGGPVMEDPGAPHAQAVEAAIVDSIDEAAGKLAPVRMRLGTTEIDIAHNRRYIVDDKCYMLWRNAERMPTEPVDKEATIIRLDGADGEPVAALVHYACHPVVLGPDNLEYTADWSGEMARLVTADTGAPCFFLQGGCGDINPYLDKTPLSEGGLESMRATGKAAAAQVLAVWNGLESAPVRGPMLAYADRKVEVGTRWDFFNPDLRDYYTELYGERRYKLYLETLAPDLALPVSVAVLGGAVALTFLPGEFFVRFQLTLKTDSLLPASLLCGYANEHHLYFPTVRDAAVGGYGGTTVTYAGVGAGEKMVTEAEAVIGELLGLLRDRPEPEDFQLSEYPPPARA